jgi:Tol biopolymer transport system component
VDRIDRTGRSTTRKVEMLTRALLCAACALAVTATPAHATFPGQTGKIVFTHFDDDSTDDNEISDIYTVSPNGRHLVNLTPDSPKSDDYASWSADGRKIAFWSTRTGRDNSFVPALGRADQEIFVMNANGSGLRQVTKNDVDDGGPTWSPSGDRLVFHRFIDDIDHADLITVRVNGTSERNLTRSPRISDRYGVWSPDGREIVFMRDDSGSENDIATIRPDGSHLRALTATPTDEEAPDWSPDGTRIAFHWDVAAPRDNWDIYVMRRDGGSPPTRLTTAEGGDSSVNPAWSPDGRKIVFNKGELFTMRADGSRQKTVLPGSFDGHHPDWQPVPKGAHADDD